jgi:hypothetical protein
VLLFSLLTGSICDGDAMTATLHTGTRTATVAAEFSMWDLTGRLVVSDFRARATAHTVVEAELAAVDRLARPRGLAWVLRGMLGDHGGLPEPTPPTWPYPYGATVAPSSGPVHHLALASVPLTGRRVLRLDAGPTLLARAVQRCAEAAAEATQCGVLVSLGGETATSGLAPAGGWRLQLPAADGAGGTVLAVDGGAVSVLGAPDGRHLRRLRGGRATWRHVVVLASNAPVAAAAARTVVLAGPAAPAWVAGHGLAARLVDVAGGVHEVGCWPA